MTRKPSVVKAIGVFLVAGMIVQWAIHTAGAGWMLAGNLGFPGGVLCATGYWLWRRRRYVRWLRGDDILEQGAPTTPARSS